MIVTVSNQQKDLPLNEGVIPEVVEEILRFEGVEADEVSVNFVDGATISELHSKYFNQSGITDCISFPIDSDPDENYRLLGEIFVCPLAAVNYAKTTGSDPYDETLLYVIHSLLHLMGYDDKQDMDRETMREAEKRHLENLHRLNLGLQEK